MKGPILPVSATTSSPQPLPARIPVARLLGSCWHSLPCWAQRLRVCAAQSLSQENPWAISLVQLVQVWYLPLPALGVEFINILSFLHLSALLAFLLFSHCLSNPGGCSSYLMLKSKHPLFGGSGRHFPLNWL